MISFLSFSFLDLLSGLSNLEINIFHISYTIIFYSFLFHFNISCLDQPGIRETKTQLERVFNFRTSHSSWILGFLNLHLEVRE